jgi:predicted nucleotidyltransferase
MTRDELIARLRKERPLFERENVRHVALFGSQARGEAHPNSDIDLMVEYRPEAKVSLVDLARLQRLLEERLGGHVQLLKAPIRRALLKAAVEADAMHVL